MTKKFLSVAVLLFFVFMGTVSVSEARVGGGRSFGSRGSRSFAPRASMPSGGGFSSSQPSAPMGQRPYTAAPSSLGGGGLMRNMAAGMAGGFLGSMLFRSMGYAGNGIGDSTGGGFGLFELLLFAGLGYLAYRMFMNRRQQTASGGARFQQDSFYKLNDVGPGPYAKATPVEAQEVQDESSVEGAIRRYDAGFNLASFKEARMDDFFSVQAAWMNRDLASVRPLVTPVMAQLLDTDMKDLRLQGRINRLENIAVRRIEATEGWQEAGSEYITLLMHANLLDYVVDEKTGAIVEGDKVTPVKFEEYWTFCRDMRGGGSSNPWLLTAIHGD